VAGDDWGWDEGEAGRARRERPARPPSGAPDRSPADGDEPFARRPASRSRRRRRASAGAVLAAMLAGFFLAGLLDAVNLEADARALPLGPGRSLTLALLRPVTFLSETLRLDRPALALNDALGRGEDEHHTLAEAQQVKPLWPRQVTAVRPLRLYVAGDSMADAFGRSLVALARSTGRVKASLDYHVSTGLSRPDYYDWPQRFVDVLVERRPDAVAVLFGANDGQSVEFEGRVLKLGSEEWKAVYRSRVGEAMDILTSGGRRVYWVGNPVMRDQTYNDTVAMMNDIYRREAQAHEGVVYVDTAGLMADAGGEYAAYLEDGEGDRVRVRMADGVHLTREGGDRMAAAVLDVIARDWGLRQE
jgi:hypothetical protein